MDNFLIPVNKSLVTQIESNLNLVDKLLNTPDLKNWWRSLDETWTKLLKRSIGIDSEPTTIELKKIVTNEHFNCIYSEILNIEPLRVFKNLQFVSLMLNKNIVSIEPLINNSNLRHLSLIATKIENIELVSNFKYLESLWLPQNIKTIEPIRNLVCLTELKFRTASAIKSLEPLQKLIQLEVLTLSDSITDLSPIDNLNKLKQLICFGVSETEANRFKKLHPNTEIIFSEEEKKKADSIFRSHKYKI